MNFVSAICVLLAASCICAAGKSTPGYCKRPAETGPCRARIPKWGYEQKSGLCKYFIYGGCGGNKNRFDSEKDCLGTCFHFDAVKYCKLVRNTMTGNNAATNRAV
ncbi:isoinhibitor K-like isoform X2 [Amblyomma americanum]